MTGVPNQPDRRTDPLVGRSIGPYRILEALGEGGFGTVYHAEQVAPMVRRVALKVIKAGMDSAQVVARFEAERQALALMDHAGITRVLDAGTTDADLGGRPYVVMELVRGRPITDFCAAGRLGVRARVELMISVCGAIQHAHQKGVIHRDLKPTNVLVVDGDTRPEPKIIDFGIAKALHQRLTERTLHTALHQFVGTPEYMSPEQAAGALDVDTRSDIYALGVLLYALLTGETPVDATSLSGLDAPRIREHVQGVEPVRPSARLHDDPTASRAAAACGLTPPALRAQVRGDLDWIVMKALEKDRTRRYSSASEFAADLGRFLRNEPVSAGPPRASYVFRKFVARHRRFVLVASLAGLALVGGLLGTSWGLRSAQRAADDARAMNAFLRDALLAVDPEVDGIDVALADVVVRAAPHIGERFGADPGREAEMQVLLGGVATDVGRPHVAIPLLEAGLAYYRPREGATSARCLALTHDLIRSHVQVHQLELAAPVVDALVAATVSEFPAHDARTLAALAARADLRMREGRLEEADREIHTVLDAAERQLGAGHEITRRARQVLVETLRIRAGGTVDPETKEKMIREHHAQLQIVVSSEPPASARALNARCQLAWAAHRDGDLQEAERLARAVFETGTERYSAHAYMVDNAAQILGLTLYQQGRGSAAVPFVEHSIEGSLRRLGPGNPYTLGAIVDGLPALVAGGAYESALRYAEQARNELRRFNLDGSMMWMTVELWTAVACVRADRIDEAERRLASVRRWAEQESTVGLRAFVARTDAEIALARGRLDDAAAALAVARSAPPPADVQLFEAELDDIAARLERAR